MADIDSVFVLDGNAAAGLLEELFVLDPTTARIECGSCGAMQAVGTLCLYAGAMGAVLRCAHCSAILMRAARTPHGRWLEMTGARYLHFSSPRASR
jgi:hypothetical protein